jgi:hypothetical protein
MTVTLNLILARISEVESKLTEAQGIIETIYDEIYELKKEEK